MGWAEATYTTTDDDCGTFISFEATANFNGFILTAAAQVPAANLVHSANLAAHNRTTIGVGEKVAVYFEPAPNSTNWSVSGGGGSIDGKWQFPVSKDAPQYEASETAANETVTGVASYNGGNITLNVVFTVLAPTGLWYEMQPGSAVRHDTNVASSGFNGQAYVLPSSVHFEGIEIHENGGNAVANGIFITLNNKPHPNGAYRPVVDNPAPGGPYLNKVDWCDPIFVGVKPPYPVPNGTLVFPIEVYYRVPTGKTKADFKLGINLMTAQSDNAIRVSVQKGGCSVSSALADATTGAPCPP